MKYCRFEHNGQMQYGLIESVGGSEHVTRLLLKPPHQSGGDMEDVPTRRIEAVPLDAAGLLAPVEPSKIVSVGRNYREHAAELGNEVPSAPLIFFKPPSAIVGTGASVRRPKLSQRVDYEGEPAVVISRACYKVADQEDVRSYVLGYTCLNDVTA